MADNAQEVNYNKQPAGLYRLFFAEMWERFSFYGMRALLTLYMVRQLLYSDEEAYGIYGAYGALVYATPIIGGWLADRVLGYRRSILLGGILMAVGHFVMAIEQELFFFGALGLIIIGNGFFKPNISSLLGNLYVDEKDPRRDKGFTIFYIGINVGALLAPLLCGTIGEVFGWHYGFGLAGVGMLLGLIVFWQGLPQFKGKGEPSNPEVYKKWAWLVYIGSFVIVPILGIIVAFNNTMDYIQIILAVLVLGYLVFYAMKLEKEKAERIFVIIILLVFSTMFWAFFEQAGSSLTLFTDQNVDRTVFGLTIPASTFQSVNPMFIVALAPLFTMLWNSLNKRKAEPNTPVKFSLGLIQLGLGFGVFVWGASVADNGLVPVAFLLLGYMLHTTGELSLSPIGLSMVTKLSPREIVSFMLGAWFLSNSFAHYIGGGIAKLTSTSDASVTNIKYIPNDREAEGISVFSEEDHFQLAVIEQLPTGNEEDPYKAGDSVFIDLHIVADEKKTTFETLPFRRRTVVPLSKPTELDLTYAVLDPSGENSEFSLLEDRGVLASNAAEVKLSEDGSSLTYTAKPVEQPRQAPPPPDEEGEVTPMGPENAVLEEAPPPEDDIAEADVAALDSAELPREPPLSEEEMTRDTLYDRRVDTLFYQICDKREEGLCDTVQFFITVSPEENLPPQRVVEELTLTTSKDTTEQLLGMITQIKYSEPKITLSHLVYDPDGDKLKVVVPKGHKPGSGFVQIRDEPDNRLKKERTLLIYSEVFFIIFLIAVGTGLVLLVISPLIRRMMHGVK